MSDLYSTFKLLFTNNLHNIKNIDEKLLFVLNQWIGNNKLNTKLFIDIEEGILTGVPKSILLKELFLRVNKHMRFIKFPKKLVKEKNKFDFLKPFFKTYYNFSNNEINIYWNLIIKYLNNPHVLISMAHKFGLDNKQRKILELPKVEFKIEKPQKQMRLI